MEKFTKQNGITLIALIITIIVMLILVAVTVNVALNGKIFENAQNAKEQTQVAANKETLFSAVVAAMGTDGEIDYNALDEEARALGFTKVGKGKYTKDGYTYTVNETTGIVTARKGTSGKETTENPWVEWGLTSPNVKYNTYFCFEGNEIIIYDDGSAYFDMGDSVGIMPKSDIEQMIENGEIIVESNSFTMEGQVTFEFIKETVNNQDVRTINLYVEGTYIGTFVEGIEIAKNIEEGIYISTIHPGQMEWTIQTSFKKKDGILFALCYLDYHDVNLQNRYYYIQAKDNRDGTVTIGRLQCGAILFDFNLESPTFTVTQTDETVEVIEESGNLFNSYSPTYNDIIKNNNETVRVYNGLYINNDKNDILYIYLNIEDDDILFTKGLETRHLSPRNFVTSSWSIHNSLYETLMELSVLNDGTTLDYFGDTITATDTDNNVTTYTYINFDE